MQKGMEENIVRIDEKDCQIIQAIMIDQLNVIDNEIKRLTQNREMVIIQLRKIRGENNANIVLMEKDITEIATNANTVPSPPEIVKTIVE